MTIEPPLPVAEGPTPVSWRDSVVPVLGLFTSFGTLICCALPALLVALGFGAVVAGLVSAAPQIVWLSENKVVVFAVAGALLAGAGVLQWRARHAPCPSDPAQALACRRLRRFNLIVYGVSVAIYLAGAFFAFLAAEIFFA